MGLVMYPSMRSPHPGCISLEAQSQMTMAGAEPEERCGVRVSARGVHKDCPRAACRWKAYPSDPVLHWICKGNVRGYLAI